MSSSSSKTKRPLPAGAANWLTLKKTLQESSTSKESTTAAGSSKASSKKGTSLSTVRKLGTCGRKRKADWEVRGTQLVDDPKGVWFDDMNVQVVNGEIVAKRRKIMSPSEKKQSRSEAKEIDISHTRHVALDCEMVTGGIKGHCFPMLGRCSIVNSHGNAIYDQYVKPLDKIFNYDTRFSGIKPCHLKDAPDFHTVQKEVLEILEGKILVGHALKNDLKVLFISHPKHMIRDTAKYPPFRKISLGSEPSLKKLAKAKLGVDIQQGSHDSVIDARMTMRLYQLCKEDWEQWLRKDSKGGRHGNPPLLSKKKERNDRLEINRKKCRSEETKNNYDQTDESLSEDSEEEEGEDSEEEEGDNESDSTATTTSTANDSDQIILDTTSHATNSRKRHLKKTTVKKVHLKRKGEERLEPTTTYIDNTSTIESTTSSSSNRSSSSLPFLKAGPLRDTKKRYQSRRLSKKEKYRIKARQKKERTQQLFQLYQGKRADKPFHIMLNKKV